MIADIPRVSCFVSGTIKAMNRAPKVVIRPKKMYVPYLMFFNMSGVTWPTMKLFIQSVQDLVNKFPFPVLLESSIDLLAEAPSAIPFDRELRGQISAMRIQAHGPNGNISITSTAACNQSHGPGSDLTPRIAKVDDKQPDHDDGGPTGSMMGRPRSLEFTQNSSDDEVAGGHAERTNHKDRLTTEFVNPDDGGDLHRGRVSNRAKIRLGGWDSGHNTVAMNMTMPTTPVANRDVVLLLMPSCMKIPAPLSVQ